jgi:16S rRNA (uracil1498-N3)-methyltransferase
VKNERHEFAFFSEEVTRLLKEQQEYTLQDKELLHRLGTIIRAKPGETIILFNGDAHARCEIVACSKKEIILRVLACKKNLVIKPAITWFLPLLEREAFEDSLYALTAMGATEIIPVITEKSRRAWGSEKELERAQRLMVAAIEQSKQFCVPVIGATKKLTDVVAANEFGIKIFFDAQGDSAFYVIQKVRENVVTSVVCCVGPEGDLTHAEKELMRAHGFMLCALTPTILKASAAVEVGMGLLRSCL